MNHRRAIESMVFYSFGRNLLMRKRAILDMPADSVRMRKGLVYSIHSMINKCEKHMEELLDIVLILILICIAT
jgi:surfactin synthase thioesterase subunit